MRGIGRRACFETRACCAGSLLGACERFADAIVRWVMKEGWNTDQMYQAKARNMLWASANHSSTARTFCRPVAGRARAAG